MQLETVSTAQAFTMKSSFVDGELNGASLSFGARLDAEPTAQLTAVPEDEEPASVIPHHPLGIKPSGNQYTATRNDRHNIGRFQVLPDEFLVVFLEHLDASILRVLGSTCRALYAFCSSDEIWKGLFIRYFGDSSSHTASV